MRYLTGADNAPVREAASTYPTRESGQGLLSRAQRVAEHLEGSAVWPAACTGAP